MGGCGGSVVENYTTAINHFYTTVFFSPCFLLPPIPSLVLCLFLCFFLCFFLYFKAVHLPLLICTPTLTVPLAICPLFFFSVPGDVLYSNRCWLLSLPHSQSISASFTLWFVYMLSLLICFLLPSRDLSPVYGTVLVNLEIDLSF